ncbi:hypothetical protein GG804_12815 [Sphingomonas histidinilytica]|uniref:type II toxin-antitoxin system VapC family toxin n=1 Tax=Rhizorhabdus histidinilytica TaxID=439228 RepID=UPI001ADCAEFE|nr:hypothetical protein [Rhizorhabdus histidinilytica]MBO9377651.1 hypothetical protein [Rhizorhabdus histidinilytica]
MIVVFDTSTLIYLFKPDAPGPMFPGTQDCVGGCSERITYLLAQLQKSKAKIIIPAPAVAELLTYSGPAGPEWVRILTTSKHFKIAAFDTLAAIECAELARARLERPKAAQGVRRKAKFDEQIVAIAKVEGATAIYSDDADIRKLVGDTMTVAGMADLELPPEDAQGVLIFDPAASDPEPDDDQS